MVVTLVCAANSLHCVSVPGRASHHSFRHRLLSSTWPAQPTGVICSSDSELTPSVIISVTWNPSTCDHQRKPQDRPDSCCKLIDVIFQNKLPAWGDLDYLLSLYDFQPAPPGRASYSSRYSLLTIKMIVCQLCSLFKLFIVSIRLALGKVDPTTVKTVPGNFPLTQMQLPKCLTFQPQVSTFVKT